MMVRINLELWTARSTGTSWPTYLSKARWLLVHDWSAAARASSAAARSVCPLDEVAGRRSGESSAKFSVAVRRKTCASAFGAATYAWPSIPSALGTALSAWEVQEGRVGGWGGVGGEGGE